VGHRNEDKKEGKGGKEEGQELGESGFDLASESEAETGEQETADGDVLADEIQDSERDTAPLESRQSGRSTARQFSPPRYHDEAFQARLDPDEPTSYTEAMGSPLQKKGKRAIEGELESIKANESWKIVELAKSQTPIKCR